MLKKRILTIVFILFIPAVGSVFFLNFTPAVKTEAPVQIDRPAMIDPDYTDIVIPPNIAPMNFCIREPGSRYKVSIYSISGKSINIHSDNPVIQIPMKKWKKLLDANKGQDMTIEIAVMNQNGWQEFTSVKNRIATEPIDDYLTYRLSEPIYVRSKNMGIYQRNITNFDVSTILHYNTLRACVNCHSFPRNDPGQMLVHIRYGDPSGMLLIQGNKVTKIDTRTKFNKAPAAYRSWHPDRDRIAFSVNIVRQFFHAVGETREAFDAASDLIVYNIEKNEVTTSPKISSIDYMETYPEWSPDGQYLYFCSAPTIDHDIDIKYQHKNIFYDLKRIRYHVSDDTWGDVETVLSAKDLGKSVTRPRFSPDGRFLLFCLADYGTFTLFRPGGDLVMMDMQTGNIIRPDINSDQPESYHCWSSNGRWFVFSSKRRNGICTLNYFSHVDEKGNVSRPFLLPQKDPTLHDHEFYTYNVPELIKSPFKISQQKLTKVAFDNEHMVKAELDPDLEIHETTGASPKATVLPAIQ